MAVLGGGVAGLSAAHELAERGFTVTVYEHRGVFGGKARSMPVPGTGTGTSALPGEHGFRFFPGFYIHLPDTMKRIPAGNRTVFDHLVAATQILLAQDVGEPELVAPAEFPTSADALDLTVRFMWDFATRLGLERGELTIFFDRLLTLLTSCDARRYAEWDQISWWQYTDADQRSAAYQKFLADGLTRSLVAARAREMSARTGGLILCQLLLGLTHVGERVDRVLDGPTSEVWIDPWTAYLQGRGVVLRSGCEVAGIDCDGHRITGVTVTPAAGRADGSADPGPQRVVADHYVAALPVERLQQLLTPALRAAEPRLATLTPPLAVRWMNGAMFYLRNDVPLHRGHTIFFDSEWSLTAISQAQFWPDVDLRQRGDGNVAGILSVDISEWDRPGRRIKKAERECTRDEIREEVWGQLVDHLGADTLAAANVDSWFLDTDIQFPKSNPSSATNLEPLLINTAGSWAHRPDAVTRIPNFFLAADFVRTYTDLATMEAANEAARRAVNGILKASGSTAAPCRIWKLHEPDVLVPFRAWDRLRWRLGRPAKPPVRITPTGELTSTGVFTGALLAVTKPLLRARARLSR